ncbi:hypothetical protein AVEN_194261-1 [Araneus ventricosus]|uniref:Uncharacterized protein n=1 Tax=Araneus ventricosus TaxID=182803 RepID=A0A4Y2GFM1_ARAVE|nr:hypothetical protein AVEN_194261-1 [Araneus ventricosus]
MLDDVDCTHAPSVTPPYSSIDCDSPAGLLARHGSYLFTRGSHCEVAENVVETNAELTLNVNNPVSSEVADKFGNSVELPLNKNLLASNLSDKISSEVPCCSINQIYGDDLEQFISDNEENDEWYEKFNEDDALKKV